MKDQFNIGCIQKHPDDHTSVDIWVNELNAMGAASPVLLYKRQGEEPDQHLLGLSAIDFLLCIQTITQRQFMLQFGINNVVCLDSTHGTNQYGFNLITMMVVDDFGEGNPVAFMICTRETESVLTNFFLAVKRRLPPDSAYKASHVMTDDASQYYNAWIAVFGSAEKRLCVWHIDRAWRKAIKENITSHDIQIEIYHMLRSVMEELDENVFKQCLSEMTAHFQEVAPRFATYFATYCNRQTEWAYCYRKGTQANTNMYVESFHNVLKSAYMERKANRRVDTLLNILLRIARDKAFERLIKVEKHSHSKKLRELDKRHVVLLQELPATTDNGWFVPSQSVPGRQYFVVLARDSCPCSLHCSACGCCPHMYQCSCVDFAVHATVCKHVHTIHQLRSSVSTTEQTDNAHSDVETLPADASVTETNDENVSTEDGHESSTEAMDTVLAAETPASSTDDKFLLQAIVSDCQQLMAMTTSGNYNKEALLVVKKHLSAAKAGLQVASLGKRSLTLTRKLTSNKKLDKQFRFCRTKNKRRPLQTAIRKPSVSQATTIRKILLSKKKRVGMPNTDQQDERHDISQLFGGSGCGDVPYCVDNEDV